MIEQPNTAAGRALHQHLREVHEAGYIGGTSWERIAQGILAIEAEARQQDGSALRERVEQVRATLAGLSLPLGATREVAQHERETALAIIDAALAALPPSTPPALDVERLGIALTNLTSRGDDSWMQRAIAERGNWEWSDWAEQIAAEYARLQEPDR